MPRLPAVLLPVLLLATIPGHDRVSAAGPSLPPLLFVSRNPVAGRPEAIPGFGPHHRTASAGGRLMIRRPGGRVEPFLTGASFHDVSDPAVSPDGLRVAFAGRVDAAGEWRIFTASAAGDSIRPVTVGVVERRPDGSAADASHRYDDIDPCWLPDGRICFASTRFLQAAQTVAVPVTNLFVVHRDGTGLHRLTTERNGGEEPVIDPETGRIVYSRWWVNRYRASDAEPAGITTDPTRARAAEPVDLWQAASIAPDGDGLKLAAGNPSRRAEMALYQVEFLADGSVLAVIPERTSLSPGGGALSLARFDRLAGPTARLDDVRAVSPASLPDGGFVVSMESTSGDFDLYAGEITPGGAIRTELLVRGLGTLELDPVALAPRDLPPVLPPGHEPPHATEPLAAPGDLFDTVHTFRFDCLNIFTNAPVDAPILDAIPVAEDVRIRFFAVLARPESAGGDTAVLVREAPVRPDGSVHEHDLPGDVAMFEQIVDRDGRILTSAGGPAHVAGLNFARQGAGTVCVGCHLGHTAIEVPINNEKASWINMSPSAQVTSPSPSLFSGGGRAAVDRKTLGPVGRVAWIALDDPEPSLNLKWSFPIEIKSFILYGLPRSLDEGIDVTVLRSSIRLFLDGREVGRQSVPGPIAVEGTRIDFSALAADSVEVRLLEFDGRILHRRAAGLSEIETIARFIDH